MQRRTNNSRSSQLVSRRGAAAVEFALVAPVFVALFLGMIQTGISIDSSHKLYAALRQSGRLASMDYTDKLQSGQTANDKIISDIKNQLAAEGIPASQITVTITHADGSNAGGTFDLSNAANALALFKIKVEVPNSALSSNNFLPSPTQKMTAEIVFRKGRSTLVD
jgi:Flp pilus assembly protein TadG